MKRVGSKSSKNRPNRSSGNNEFHHHLHHHLHHSHSHSHNRLPSLQHAGKSNQQQQQLQQQCISKYIPTFGGSNINESKMKIMSAKSRNGCDLGSSSGSSLIAAARASAARKSPADSDQVIRYFVIPSAQYRDKTELIHDFGYRMDRKLGEGGFGSIYLARDERDHSAVVACKWMDLGDDRDNAMMLDTANELKMMLEMRHPHVVKVFCYFIVRAENKNQMYLFMELADGGDLSKFLSERGALLDEPAAKRYFAQILVGMHHLHCYGIAHRDMKLTNVLLKRNERSISGDYVLLLADFGMSAKVVLSRGRMRATNCGTPAYMAPEIWLEQPYDAFRVDVWALGVSLHEMLSLQNPFDHDNSLDDRTFCRNVTLGEWRWSSRIVPRPSAELDDLVRSALCVDFRRRISLDAMILHAWNWPTYQAAHVLSDVFKMEDYKRLQPIRTRRRRGEGGEGGKKKKR